MAQNRRIKAVQDDSINVSNSEGFAIAFILMSDEKSNVGIQSRMHLFILD